MRKEIKKLGNNWFCLLLSCERLMIYSWAEINFWKTDEAKREKRKLLYRLKKWKFFFFALLIFAYSFLIEIYKIIQQQYSEKEKHQTETVRFTEFTFLVNRLVFLMLLLLLLVNVIRPKTIIWRQTSVSFFFGRCALEWFDCLHLQFV